MLHEIRVENGILRGVPGADPRITVYRGIPYARPPIGALRWRAPQPAEDWDGVRLADTFAPMAIQHNPGLDWSQFYTKEVHPTAFEYAMSEDCLYLNVWTPARSIDEKLPVFVFIHGGGYTGGYSYTMEFDGEHVARRGCVFVTIAYRLGALGFFAHPDLDAESPGASQGNFGFLDQLAAIRWLKRNIAAFGGDPDRMTIGGQSAGGGSVIALLSSPQIEGLISGAVMMSTHGLRPAENDSCTKESAQQEGRRLLEQLNVTSVAQARRLPPEVIFETMQGIRQSGLKCCVDGAFLTESPRNAILNNRWPRIPLLIGYTHDEGLSFFGPRMYGNGVTLEAFDQGIRKAYGAHAETYLKLADVHSSEDISRLHRSEEFHPFRLTMNCLAKVAAEQNRTVYMYEFDPDIPGDDGAGSFHGSDLWFVFDSLSHNWRPFRGKHYDLARQVCTYFVNFCRNGSPNGLDDDGTLLPDWEAYTCQNPAMMIFDDTPHLGQELQTPLLKLRQDHLMGRLKN